MLPPEIQTMIFSYLSDADLLKRIPLVCKNFNRIVQTEHLWKERTIARFENPTRQLYFNLKGSWKAAFIALKKLQLESLKEKLLKKQENDLRLQKETAAAGHVFGSNLSIGHHYPIQSTTTFFFGKERKITYFKPY